ncbi:hypothetical protein ACIPM5_30615 [Streptomyces microflavus]|uniref:hypothetical protein n=1 Tax=Streptomyces microflavus TaxID=1919 RepID=UPI0033AF8091
MSFNVSFIPDRQSGALGTASERLEPGSGYETLVVEACSALSGARAGEFHMGGFGCDEWPVDVAYDLSAFMEQLPPLLEGIRKSREVDVDLYSQGVERKLSFCPSGDLVVIHCESRTNWIPNPVRESIDRGELIAMLSKLAIGFAVGLRAINSELSEVAPFEAWLKGEV